MKQLFLFLITIACTAPAWADREKNIVSSILRSATVYRSGAELMHTARAVLVQGNNELVIDNISNKIDINSLQIGSSGVVTILSMEFATNYLKADKKSAIINKLEDSLSTLNDVLSGIQVVIRTDQELLDLLKTNKGISGAQTGVSVAELTKMVDYYKAKTMELQSEILRYKEKENKTLTVIAKINAQIKEEEQKNNKTVGRLQLQLFCPVGGQYDFNVSYVTPNAFWNPTYDVRVENISKPVGLFYKAKLVQSSGIDWQQVKLSLSTSVPAQQNNAPSLKSWFLVYNNPIAIRGYNNISNHMASSSSLDEVVVVGYGTQRKSEIVGAADDTDPLYVVNGNIVSKEEYKKIDKRAIKSINVLKDAQATSTYGSRASNGAIVATLKDELENYVDIKDNELNVVFDIELPYDVPSNGKEQNVTLKEFKLPANFHYYTAPRVDKDAYLLGGFTNWAPLNLLPGEANIIFEGTYIGKTSINPGSVQDTLNLTVGRDKRVVVRRDKLTDFSSVKFLGSNKKQTVTYEITVRNNKKEKISMELKDQFPISSNKEIEVDLLEASGASVDNETGLLTWKLDLAPGEVKKYRLSYSVKYPKDKVVNL